MLSKAVAIFCAIVAVSANPSHVTFKSVTVHGYSMFTHKFKVTVASSNSLKENLPKSVFDMIKIEECQIPILYEDSVSDIDNLDVLVLDHDEIEEIRPGAFKNVPQLRKLVITNNKIEQIKRGVFNHLNIGSLSLSKNSINTIAPGAFDDMPELLNVDLADNQLKIWNKQWFANTPLLTRVSFQNNLIEEIPDGAFLNFRGEKQFGSVPLTINIVLSNNKIAKIHKHAFRGLSKINNLWLDGNELEDWDENLLSGITLNSLRINDNKIVCLSGNLKNIFVADTTHIDGNPWDCGCLKNMELWISENGKNVLMFYSKLTCDAERIQRKIEDLNNRLKELRKNDDVNETE